jgi:hypothetical protein
MSAIHNEQTKLTATYLNGPVFSYVFGSVAGQPLWAVALVAVICILVSAILHFTARRILTGLIP